MSTETAVIIAVVYTMVTLFMITMTALALDDEPAHRAFLFMLAAIVWPVSIPAGVLWLWLDERKKKRWTATRPS